MYYSDNQELEPKGYDCKSGWMGTIESNKKQLFSTEGEYDEYIKDHNKGED